MNSGGGERGIKWVSNALGGRLMLNVDTVFSKYGTSEFGALV